MSDAAKSQPVCWCERSGYAILSCSGTSAAGTIGHKASREIARDNDPRLVCLASVAAGDDEALWTLRQSKEILAVDGCSKDCARKVLRQAGFQESAHLRITDLGFTRDEAEAISDNIEYAAAEARRLIRW